MHLKNVLIVSLDKIKSLWKRDWLCNVWKFSLFYFRVTDQLLLFWLLSWDCGIVDKLWLVFHLRLNKQNYYQSNFVFLIKYICFIILWWRMKFCVTGINEFKLSINITWITTLWGSFHSSTVYYKSNSNFMWVIFYMAYGKLSYTLKMEIKSHRIT